jgi:hypothetical protein
MSHSLAEGVSSSNAASLKDLIPTAEKLSWLDTI